MGTRADFYIGRGKSAEWLGSIAWDGYPDGIDAAVLTAKTEHRYRAAVDTFLAGREDATRPAQGWPWPWHDSGTTDYAYAFTGNAVRASRFGRKWFNPRKPAPDDDGPTVAVFPDMTARTRVRLDQGSGLIVIRGAP